MSIPVYNFEEQLKIGKKGEEIMGKYHAPFYIVTKTLLAQDKQGVDFIFTSYSTEYPWKVEVKTDQKSQDTGNLFMETISKDTTNKQGWAETSQCEVFIQYRWYADEVMYFWMKDIKNNIDEWAKKYRVVAAQNTEYKTWGVLLPLKKAREFTFATRSPINHEWIERNYKTWSNQ